MSWSALIDRLAGLAGIEPWYYDIRGTRHETALATKILVFGALGLNVSSIAAVNASMAGLEEEPWRRMLAPYVVARVGSLSLDLFLPAQDADRNCTWEIAPEAGDALRGEFRPSALSLLGTRDIEGRRIEHRRLEIGAPLNPGYYRVTVTAGREARATLALAPARCYLPPALANGGQRLWALGAQAYTLRSNRDWGVGDFGDLAQFCAMAGAKGASAIAVNPFHALFPQRPAEASPYSPSSRLFLNPAYIDVAAAPYATECPELGPLAGSLKDAREARLVDYPKVLTAKKLAFESLFAKFRAHAASGNALPDYARFVAEQGAPLQRFVAFALLSETYGLPWQSWPKVFQDPASVAVSGFVRERQDRADFHTYLQFVADAQLRHAAARSRESGMEVGIVRDLAMGINPDGADAWSQQKCFAFGLRCGAPPDDFNQAGQEWGILPLDPLKLRDNLEPYAAALRANMRHAGGLRIDHVIGLQRQFLVPLGAGAAEGCYLRFPFEELLGVLALESHRNRCLIVGEDLGTVPEGFRERMQDQNISGCALHYFERSHDGRARPPQDYRRNAAISIGTHDLPPLKGYWEGRDIALKKESGFFSEAEAQRAIAERQSDRARLVEGLAQAGFDSRPSDAAADGMSTRLRDAIHTYLASSHAQLFIAMIDDLTDEREQINVPGTTTSHPNWCRKLSLSLEDPAFAEALERLARICAAQGRSVAR